MDVVRQTLSVVLVFVVLGIALWVLRRAGGAVSLRRSLGLGRASDRARAIETVERLSLTPQHALHLVRWNGRELLVSTHAQGCTVLGECARIKDA